jgi:serine protease inhibitor
MKQSRTDRRLLLQAGLGALLGFVSRPSLADILEAGDETPHDLDSGSLLSAQTRLGANLIRKLAEAKKPDANVVVSPASLASILAFVELGASDPMRAALHRAVGFSSTARRRIRTDLNAIRTSVAAVAKDGPDSPLAMANLLVFDPSTRPNRLALLGVSGAGADVLVDRLTNPKTIERINQWVKRRTHDLIPSIIEESPNTLGLIAINALYFKDRWQAPFDPARTQIERFRAVAGDVDVPMMHSSARKLSLRQDERFIATELAYADDDFRLVIVTTRSEPARVGEFAPVADWLGGKKFDTVKGDIAMPRLTLSSSEELLRPLDGLGLAKARREPGALNGFSEENLMMARIVQRTELRLDERGTEAAAATAVITTRSLADNYVKVVFDKPFVFALRHQKSGLILMTGYVGAPRMPPAT